MLRIPLLLAATLSILGSRPLLAQIPEGAREQRRLSGAETQLLSALRFQAKDAFGKLFVRQPAGPNELGQLPPFQSSPPSAKRQIVCGLVIILVDPSIDARMITEPKDTTAKGTIKAIEPRVCRPE